MSIQALRQIFNSYFEVAINILTNSNDILSVGPIVSCNLSVCIIVKGKTMQYIMPILKDHIF